MKILRIIACCALALLVPVLIDHIIFGNSILSNISNEAWASFLGSYIGGLCTMGGVFITIFYNEKKLAIQKKEQLNSENESRRRSMRPYLDTRCCSFDHNMTVGSNDRVVHVSQKSINVYQSISESMRESLRQGRRAASSGLTPINYIIRNIGAGSAVDMTVTINNHKEAIAIAKDEIVNFYFLLDEDIKELSISIDYNDVEQYGYYEKSDCIYVLEDNGVKNPSINHVKPQYLVEKKT